MPIYEYRCQSCGKEFELFRAVSASDDPVCKFCGGTTKKLISRSSFHLKGSGWYVTDYARKGASASEKSSDSSSSESKDKSSTKSESSGSKD